MEAMIRHALSNHNPFLSSKSQLLPPQRQSSLIDRRPTARSEPDQASSSSSSRIEPIHPPQTPKEIPTRPNPQPIQLQSTQTLTPPPPMTFPTQAPPLTVNISSSKPIQLDTDSPTHPQTIPTLETREQPQTTTFEEDRQDHPTLMINSPAIFTGRGTWDLTMTANKPMKIEYHPKVFSHARAIEDFDFDRAWLENIVTNTVELPDDHIMREISLTEIPFCSIFCERYKEFVFTVDTIKMFNDIQISNDNPFEVFHKIKLGFLSKEQQKVFSKLTRTVRLIKKRMEREWKRVDQAEVFCERPITKLKRVTDSYKSTVNRLFDVVDNIEGLHDKAEELNTMTQRALLNDRYTSYNEKVRLAIMNEINKFTAHLKKIQLELNGRSILYRIISMYDLFVLLKSYQTTKSDSLRQRTSMNEVEGSPEMMVDHNEPPAPNPSTISITVEAIQDMIDKAVKKALDGLNFQDGRRGQANHRSPKAKQTGNRKVSRGRSTSVRRRRPDNPDQGQPRRPSIRKDSRSSQRRTSQQRVKFNNRSSRSIARQTKRSGTPRQRSPSFIQRQGRSPKPIQNLRNNRGKQQPRQQRRQQPPQQRPHTRSQSIRRSQNNLENRDPRNRTKGNPQGQTGGRNQIQTRYTQNQQRPQRQWQQPPPQQQRLNRWTQGPRTQQRGRTPTRTPTPQRIQQTTRRYRRNSTSRSHGSREPRGNRFGDE